MPRTLPPASTPSPPPTCPPPHSCINFWLACAHMLALPLAAMVPWHSGEITPCSSGLGALCTLPHTLRSPSHALSAPRRRPRTTPIALFYLWLLRQTPWMCTQQAFLDGYQCHPGLVLDYLPARVWEWSRISPGYVFIELVT